MIRLRPLLFVCIFAATGAGSAVRAQGPTENLDSGNPRTQALFVKALTEAYLGDHEQAVLLFTNVLSTQPGEPAVLAALAESYIALGQPAEALFYAAEAVEHGRNEPSYYTTLAELQAELNQPDAAISTYSALLSLSPRDAEALAALGLLQEQSGQFEEALATYVQLISAAGETIALRLRMEALHARLGNTEEALRMLELAADASRNEPMIQFRLGMAYGDTGRTSDAIHILERYLTLEPANVEGTLMLADLLEDRGEYERAITLRNGLTDGSSTEEQLRRAALLYERAKDDPEAAEEARQILGSLADDEDAPTDVLLMLGDLAFHARDFALAADVLGRAIQQDPRNQEAWEQAAASRLYVKNAEGAVELAEEGLILFPGNVALYRVAAYGYARLDRPRKGIAKLAEALAILNDEYPDKIRDRTRLLSLRGLLHDKLGEDRLADEAFEAALALDAENALVLNNYAYILSEREERLNDALDMALRANELNEDNPYFLDTLGWVYFKLGRLAEAAEAIEQAIAADDAFALLYDHLGDVYDAQGRTADARDAWARSLELDSENEALQTKLEGL